MRLIAITENIRKIYLRVESSTVTSCSSIRFLPVNHIHLHLLKQILLESATYHNNVLVCLSKKLSHARIDLAKEHHLLLEPTDPITSNGLANSLSQSALPRSGKVYDVGFPSFMPEQPNLLWSLLLSRFLTSHHARSYLCKISLWTKLSAIFVIFTRQGENETKAANYLTNYLSSQNTPFVIQTFLPKFLTKSASLK